MNYRLALDLGSTSIGWAVFLLDENNKPKAIIRTGVRIFSDGRNPKDKNSLAVRRREARAARRRRDRLLKRKNRFIKSLVKHGLFPVDIAQRKKLELLDPYKLRAEGLDRELSPEEFGRALFHLSQRRGFKSNRKTDSKENDSSVMKLAINKVKESLNLDNSRTIGELLYKRQQKGLRVRARLNQERVINDSGRAAINKYYDLYIDRSMVEHEFDLLWKTQSEFNSLVFHDEARDELKDILFYQRKLVPVNPGRCTYYTNEERANLILPSVQRFRIYQEINNLRWLNENLVGEQLTVEQRDLMVTALDISNKKTFLQLRKIANLSSDAVFNIEDEKRKDLKGNVTSTILSKKDFYGNDWHKFDHDLQDEIVLQLLNNESHDDLITWLIEKTEVDFDIAEKIANINLPSLGYGNLSLKAIQKILIELKKSVCTYDKAVINAGFEHHSVLDARSNGEILPELPYYGKVLQRSVSFGTNNANDNDEKRYGRIANPTVHIGLNQIKLVVNEIINEYGHPSQVVIEVARDLKQGKQEKDNTVKKQTENQRRNQIYRREIAEILGVDESRIGRDFLHKRILWEELSFDVSKRCCPYTGEQISLSMLFSNQVEIEHILPFSQTLDNSLNNKTVALVRANRAKANHTPWEAFGKKAVPGFDYEHILLRAASMPKAKRYRFAPDGMDVWLRDNKDFLARALNDTRYLSKLSKQYLEYICPQDTWVIPGQLTSLLRNQYGLNNADILGWQGQKNREDHRHHAVDACVIGITDRSLLQKVATSSARAREKQRNSIVDNMPLPWETYREHVKRAVNNIWVSHRPDHSYEGAMHNDTAYSLLPDGFVGVHKMIDGERVFKKEKLSVIPMISRKALDRHGLLKDGSPRPYKGYLGNSNYCIEIVRNENNSSWSGEVVSTYEAYQIIRKNGYDKGWEILRNSKFSVNKKPLVMRLMINDMLRLEHNDEIRVVRVAKIGGNGQLFLADIHESNVDARNRNKKDSFSYISKTSSTLLSSKARPITITPAGRLFDKGFKR